MDIPEHIETAARVRKRGNEFYQKWQLDEATKAYQKAASLDPSDPSPLSNLSIVSFEAGRYAECVGFVVKALALLKTGPEADLGRQRLLVRQAKAFLHLSSWEEAENLLGQIAPGGDAENLRGSLKGSRELDTFSPQPALLREMLLQLPRFRSCIRDELEFYGAGHDDAESQYTTALQKSTDKDPILSIIFCGVGDARHLFQTLLHYCSKSQKSQKLHITMVDIHPAVVARDLIFFHLLHEAVIDHGSKDILLLSLSYLFCTQIIPPFAWDTLQGAISKLVVDLERKQQPFNFTYVSMPQMGMIVRVLKSWQQGPATEYKTSEIRRMVARQTAPMREIPGHNMGKFEADNQIFDDFHVMFPPAAFLSRCEPELSVLVKDYQNRQQGARKHIDKYLNKHWKVNSTLLDAEWLEPANDDISTTDFDPFQVIEALTKKTQNLDAPDENPINYAADFFKRVGLSILSLRSRLTVEIIIGEMADVLERTRYGLLDRPKPGHNPGDQELSAAMKWPEKYHIIHMSNIPDYTGGSLTTFLYAGPVLMQGAGAVMTSRVLRNTGQWKSIDQFNSEYLLMHDRDKIQKHFQVKLAKELPAASAFESLMLPFSMVMRKYQLWGRCKSGSSSLEELLPKPSLCKWLFSHFLKICLPFPRPEVSNSLVYAPNNMTAFLRLLVQMAEIGYPSHWLSFIITSLGSGSITSTARAPRKYVLNPAAVDMEYSSRTMCVKPWATEFATLVTMWHRFLPFAVVVPSGILPSPEIIVEYSIWIPPGPASSESDCGVPHFMLVFWNHRKYNEPPKNLRAILLDDEKGDTTTSARDIRSDVIQILSTFKWVTRFNIATFWMRSDLMKKMLEEDWKVFIWRVDTWERLTPGQSLKNNIDQGRTWKECVTST